MVASGAEFLSGAVGGGLEVEPRKHSTLLEEVARVSSHSR